MRRSLVLTQETARHPFRASLPPHVFEMRDWTAEPKVPWRQTLWTDVRGFAQAYCACLLAVTAFIA
jgi:hypothetical protein